MNRFLIILLLSISLSSYSQNHNPYQIKWEKTIGGGHRDGLYSITSNNDGSYVLGGHTHSNDDVLNSKNHGNMDCWIIKIDSIGNIIWDKTYGGSKDDGLYDIEHTKDSGYIFVGFSESTDYDIKSGNKGKIDSWVVKIDSVGNLEWENTFGGSSWEYTRDILETEDGGYLIGGQTQSTDGDVSSGGNGIWDIWIVKIDSLGELLWEKTYGGTDIEEFHTISPTYESGYIIGGGTNSDSLDVQSGNHGRGDYWIVKVDSIGEIQWEHTYGGSREDNLRYVLPLEEGGYILGGYSCSEDGDVSSGTYNNCDIWIVKVDSIGGIIWEKSYGKNPYDSFNSVIPNNNKGFLLFGSTIGTINENNIDYKEDIWVIEIDSEGEILWEKTYGGSSYDLIYCSEKMINGGFLLGGETMSNDGDIQSDNKGEGDYWIFKIGSNSSPLNITLSDTTLDENSSIGTVIGTLHTEDQDIFDNYTYSITSVDGDTSYNSFTISSDTLFSSQVFDYEYKKSFIIEIQTEDSGGNTFSKFFTIRIKNVVEVGIDDDIIDSKYKIYPNPVKDKLTIETNNNNQLELRLFDVNGTQIINQKEIYNKSEINVHRISSGIYFVKLLEDNTVVHQQKIVKY